MLFSFQGVKGICCRIATKILPHNFIELIEGSIEILNGNKSHILPDFITGGMAEFHRIQPRSKRRGKVKVRARLRGG